MRTSSTLLALCLAPLTYLACNQDAEVGAVDDADAGVVTTPDAAHAAPDANATADANGNPATNDAASDASAIVLDDFITMHRHVGCSEIGEGPGGDILVAGTAGAAMLNAVGTTKLSFGNQGILEPMQYAGDGSNYVFARFQLDGQGTGFYGIAFAQGPSTIPKQVFRYDLTGGAAAGFAGPALAGGTDGFLFAQEPALADAAGTLHVVYGAAGGGAASHGAKRVEASGLVTSYSHDSVGATLETVGPFSSVFAFASAGADHYVHGIVKADNGGAVFLIDQPGTENSAFTRVPAPKESRLRVGGTALFVIESDRVTAFSRTTGAPLTTFTGNGGGPGELIVNTGNTLWGAGVDEQDRLYLVQGHLMTRFLPTGAVDPAFGPVELNSIPTQFGDQIAVVGFGPSRVLVSHCITVGGDSNQTTYAFAR